MGASVRVGPAAAAPDPPRPTPMARIPDRDEYQRRWRALEFADRRRILRAVNRGEALTHRKEAALAVALARKQQRFWSRAWLFAPLLGLFSYQQGVVAVALNAAVATLALGAAAWFWLRRARRAEATNFDAARR